MLQVFYHFLYNSHLNNRKNMITNNLHKKQKNCLEIDLGHSNSILLRINPDAGAI
jgi:hypothetical protein